MAETLEELGFKPLGPFPAAAEAKSTSTPTPAKDPLAPLVPALHMGNLGQGMLDPLYGGTQLAAHLAKGFFPSAVTSAVSDFVDKSVKDREAKIAAERGPDTGFNAGRLAGNALSPINYAGAGMEIGSGLLGLVSRGAAAGGVAGALEPVTDTENFPQEKATQIGAGSAIGGAFGLGSKAIGIGAAAASKYILKNHPEAAENEAVNILLKRWGQDSKYGGGSAADALDLVNAASKPRALSDRGVSGTNVRSLAGSVARSPGESKDIAEKFLRGRDAEAAERLDKDISTYVYSGPSAYRTVSTLMQARSAASKPLYEDVRALEHIWSPRLDEFFSNPRIQAGFRRGIELERDLATAEGRSMSLTQLGVDLDIDGNVKLVDKPNLLLLDMAKRGLDAIIADSRDQFGRVNAEGYAASKLRGAFLAEIDSLDTHGIYRKARETWAGYSASKDAVQLGQKLLSEERGPEEIAEIVSGMSENDKEFLRLGIADNLRARLGEITKLTGDVKGAEPLLKSQQMIRQLRPAFKSSADLDRFTNAVLEEHAMKGSSADLLGNSKTIERGLEETGGSFGEMANTAKGLITGNVFKKAAIMWDMYKNLGAIPPPRIKEELAKILFTSRVEPRVQAKLRGQASTQLPNPMAHVGPRAGQAAPFAAVPATEALAPSQENSQGGNQIPQFAEGGVVTQPTVAMIGERGPEAVVPLDNPAAAQQAADVAAQRIQAPYAKALAQHPPSGLLDIGNYYGDKLMSAMMAPYEALTGSLQVTDPVTGMPTPQAMQRAQGVANMAMTGGIPMAQRGALGMAGGKLGGPGDPVPMRNAANANRPLEERRAEAQPNRIARTKDRWNNLTEQQREFWRNRYPELQWPPNPEMAGGKLGPADFNAYGKSEHTYTPGSNENVPGGGKGTSQEDVDASLERLNSFLAPLNRRDKFKVLKSALDDLEE